MRKIIELRASNAHRWMVCAGQPQAIADIVDEASAAADRGTVAHALLEIGLRLHMAPADLYRYEGKAILQKIEGRRADHILVDEDMIEGVSHVIDYVNSYLAKYPNADYEAECELDATGFVGKPSGGTSDLILHDLPRELVIVDYKNGVQHVDHVDNHQLRIYGLGAIDRYSDKINLQTKIRTVIIQPNSRDNGSPVRETVYSYNDIIKFAELAASAAKEAYRKNPKRVPGEHCNYCRAAGACKTYGERALHQAALDFALISEDEPMLQDSQNLDNDELAKIIRALPMLKRWVQNIEDEAVRRILHGQDIPEYKLVPSSPHRRWKDTDTVVGQIVKYGGKELAEFLAPRQPLSPAKMEKLLPKLAPKNTKLLSRLQGSITRNPAEPRLAHVDDKRGNFNAGEDFK